VLGALAWAIVVGASAGSTEGQVTVDRRAVTLGQVVDLSRLPPALRDRAATLEMAVIPETRSKLVLSRRRLIERARAMMPVLGPRLADGPDTMIEVRLAAAAREKPAAAAPACMKALRDTPVNAVLGRDDFVAADCAHAPGDQPLGYDRAIGAARALRDIHQGEVIAAAPAAVLAAVRPGQILYVTTRVGPVQVTRAVQAAQATTGGGVFVRTTGGSVFSAPAPRGGQ
jgi:hypothetical protein